MNEKIEIYMISGFLGSGKTTFLKQMIEYMREKKLGVLINEIGQVSIDTERVKKESIELKEIVNGSIYCACLKGDFIRALIEFAKTDIEVLLIENSGMADPANIHRILAEVGDQITSRYQYRGSLCIVDAVGFLKHVRVLVSISNQILASDTILVNKIDLVEKEKRKEIHEKIREINPRVSLFDTEFATIPMEQVMRELVDNDFDSETSNKCYQKPLTYVLEWKDTIYENDLLRFIDSYKDKTYRMKGKFWNGFKMEQIDVVEELVRISQIETMAQETSNLVMIFKEKDIGIEEIRNKWNRCSSIWMNIIL